MTNLLDRETGARLRAGLAVALAVVTVAVAVLQTVLSSLDSFPDWEHVGAVSMWVQGAVSLLGRFTALGERIKE